MSTWIVCEMNERAANICNINAYTSEEAADAACEAQADAYIRANPSRTLVKTDDANGWGVQETATYTRKGGADNSDDGVSFTKVWKVRKFVWNVFS